VNVLLVSPFAPYRDGIAAYALQELRGLREAGHTVEVCSPLPSAARWHLPLGGPAGMSQLVAKAGGYDRVVLQFGPELAFGRCRSAGQRVAVWLGLAALARRRPLDLRLHEIEYGPLDQNPLERAAARLALTGADRVTVHTAAEREAIDARLGVGARIEVIDHGRDFRPAIRRTRAEARAQLGLPTDGYRFVAIGFLQHHKGFDRAVEAVERLDGDVHLHVVGSARVDHPDIAAHLADLRQRCARAPNATLHEGYVSDVEFDLWLQAADAAVLPYREIWSSGVLERARLFGTQIVASDLPQLRDQAPPGTVFFTDVDELSVTMDKLRSSAPGGSVADGRGVVGGPLDGAAAPDPAGTARPWAVNPLTPDRIAIQRQIAERAREAAIGPSADHGRAGGRGPHRRPVDGLVALGPLRRPEPASARPGVAPLKRLVDRLTAWRIEPIATRLEELQRATTDAIALLENAAEDDPTGSPDADGSIR
jgi:glycosyltransferase involved in cell wall biosynthesis